MKKKRKVREKQMGRILALPCGRRKGGDGRGRAPKSVKKEPMKKRERNERMRRIE